MSFQFPETPILLYPSLLESLGADAAILLTLYHEQSRKSGSEIWQLDHTQWLALARFWDEDQVAQLTSELVSAGFIDARFTAAGGIRVELLALDETTGPDPLQEECERVSRLPVVETCPVTLEPELQGRSSHPGPAPTFGGSIGWARNTRKGDELHALFQQHEARNQQLHSMCLGWQPSDNFFALLTRHNISAEFAQGCVDEFVLYWLDKDRKETSWDQKFLGWVKREWVRKQTEEGRQQRLNQERQTGVNHEDSRRDTRENRKRVTQAIMDIKDTDW